MLDTCCCHAAAPIGPTTCATSSGDRSQRAAIASLRARLLILFSTHSAMSSGRMLICSERTEASVADLICLLVMP